MIGAELREALQRLREEVREAIQQAVSVVVEYPIIKGTTESGDNDTMGTADEEGETERPARRVEPWGVRSRPVSGIRGAIIKVLAGASNALLVGISSNRYGPSDLEEGETALYCLADGTLVKLTKVGKIMLNSATGQAVAVVAGTGADVTLDATLPGMVKFNGGTFPVARAGCADTAGGYPITGGSLTVKSG